MSGEPTDGPKGFRDVWWCYILNEPMIITYDGDRPVCVNCGQDPTCSTLHVFMVHLCKPVRAE